MTSKYSSSRYFAISIHVSVSFLTWLATVFVLEACKVCAAVRFSSTSVSLQKQNVIWLEIISVTEDLRLHDGLSISLFSTDIFILFLSIAHVHTYAYYSCFCNWDGMMLDSVVVFVLELFSLHCIQLISKPKSFFALKFKNHKCKVFSSIA